MKIALVSDTHGVCRKELFDHIKNCDYLIHTGDFDNERTYNRFLNCGIPMYAVRGNCDHGEWASYLHEFVSVPINGKLFYLVHNKADLPFDLTDADFIIFGHTHVFTHYDRYGKVLKEDHILIQRVHLLDSCPPKVVVAFDNDFFCRQLVKPIQIRLGFIELKRPRNISRQNDRVFFVDLCKPVVPQPLHMAYPWFPIYVHWLVDAFTK